MLGVALKGLKSTYLLINMYGLKNGAKIQTEALTHGKSPVQCALVRAATTWGYDYVPKFCSFSSFFGALILLTFCPLRPFKSHRGTTRGAHSGMSELSSKVQILDNKKPLVHTAIRYIGTYKVK